MILKNVTIYTEEGNFKTGEVQIEEGRIKNVCESLIAASDGADCLDGKGCYLIPGMIDIHLHGCRGYDFCDADLEALREIACYQAAIGVTTFAPATMTLSEEKLCEILAQGANYYQGKIAGKYMDGADLAGINMEGPFICKEKKGAQNAEYIRKPEIEVFRKFQKSAEGLVKYIGVAPETEGAIPFIEEARKEVRVTVAHSNADYEKAKAAFEAGACHVTHLYNGMSSYSHREPGIVGAAWDCKHVEAEMICDGIHVHPSVIRATFAMLGKERIIFVSDSIRATGMQDGEYELGGQTISVKGHRAVIKGTDTIAGSVVTLPECLRYVVKVAGIPLEDALRCVTRNPAVSLGIYQECGSVSAGKKADLVLLDKDLMVAGVIKNGRLLDNKFEKTQKLSK